MAAHTGAILVVEDCEDEAKMLQTALDGAGIVNPIELVHSVPDAISCLKRVIPFDNLDQYPPVAVILLDLKLPGMDGFQFLDWLKLHPEFDEILVIVISGLDDLTSIRRAYGLGADSFLTKPCGLLDLQNLMEWFPGYWQCHPLKQPSIALETPNAQQRPKRARF